MSEVRKIVMKSINKKAPRLDGVVNEDLKNDICIKVLRALFKEVAAQIRRAHIVAQLGERRDMLNALY